MYDIEICLGRHSCFVCPFSPLLSSSFLHSNTSSLGLAWVFGGMSDPQRQGLASRWKGSTRDYACHGTKARSRIERRHIHWNGGTLESYELWLFVVLLAFPWDREHSSDFVFHFIVHYIILLFNIILSLCDSRRGGGTRSGCLLIGSSHVAHVSSSLTITIFDDDVTFSDTHILNKHRRKSWHPYDRLKHSVEDALTRLSDLTGRTGPLDVETEHGLKHRELGKVLRATVDDRAEERNQLWEKKRYVLSSMVTRTCVSDRDPPASPSLSRLLLAAQLKSQYDKLLDREQRAPAIGERHDGTWGPFCLLQNARQNQKCFDGTFLRCWKR